MDYELTPQDLKNYPHFDAPLAIDEIQRLVTDPARVARNAFYPFMLFYDEWQPYRTLASGRPEKKTRPIRYAARRDAYIFAHYRRILSELYEARLNELGIADCPIAYRQLLKTNRTGGKCNIDFAKDAFDEIVKLGKCVAVALDISKYFESLDHSRIESIWCDLIGSTSLPDDHNAVFRNITRYHYVDKQEVYRRLGYLGPIRRGRRIVEGYTVPFRKIPKQLCSPENFRLKICGGDPSLPNLIQVNKLDYGIPQGAPISDLIANFYLMEFDKVTKEYVLARGGRYMRYSDDLLLILPGDETMARDAVAFVTSEIANYGERIAIKGSKTCIVGFRRQAEGLEYEHLEGPQGRGGFEYLGFRFDGKRVYVRESTISGVYRKIAGGAKSAANRHTAAHPNKNAKQLAESFNYSRFSQKYGRVDKYDPTDYRKWTFYSYLKRASSTFGDRGDRILKQMQGFKGFMQDRVRAYIERAVARRVNDDSKAE